MRLDLEKILENETELEDRWDITQCNINGEELRGFLLNELPRVMEDIVDPNVNSNDPSKYVYNLFNNRLGDFSKRYIIRAYDNNYLIGMLIGIRKESRFHILTVGVVKRYRKRKVGLSLLERCFSDMYLDNIKKILINVHSDNIPAISLYNKYGFMNIANKKSI